MTPPWKARMESWKIADLTAIFGSAKPIVGMVHCWPMPGAPGYRGHGIDDVIAHALADARALEEGGCDGLIVENMWDVPFRAGSSLAPESIAAHAVVARAVGESVGIPMGINVVHNGGTALLGIAIAAGAAFVRVCMFTGAGIWDGGQIDEGCAAELMRRRSDLGAESIKLFADVDKKHSVRFPGIDLATHIEWTRFFGADALIVSGRMTGDAPDLDYVREAKRLAGDRPVLLGSGATADNAAAYLEHLDGIIVGTGVKVHGEVANPVDPERVAALVAAARSGSDA